jgi:hypothetical protein
MGKGSSWRKTDFKKYFENWKDIKKSKTSKVKEEIKTKSKTTFKY